MFPIPGLAFLTSGPGKILVGIVAALALAAGVYYKGYFSGKAREKAYLEPQIQALQVALDQSRKNEATLKDALDKQNVAILATAKADEARKAQVDQALVTSQKAIALVASRDQWLDKIAKGAAPASDGNCPDASAVLDRWLRQAGYLGAKK